MCDNEALLRISHLRTHFTTLKGTARAVEDVSFVVEKGEVLGIVGESGCGKSVTAQSVMRLVPDPPGRIVGGEILFDGIDLARADMKTMGKIRGRRISMIFQEPMTSLNPVKTVGDQIAEMFRLHMGMNRKASLRAASGMLEQVKIPDAGRRLSEYPHQMSGGMRQRVMIAMALSCEPELLIADEPTTALDVTVQAQIMDLMAGLRRKKGTSVMLITHDLGVIAEMADRVVVMYAGKVVESARTSELFELPLHPYTRGLLASVPVIGKGSGRLAAISGVVPGLYEDTPGCRFAPRCPRKRAICTTEMPALVERVPGHEVRCHVPEAP